MKFNDGRIHVYRRQGERFADVNVREHDHFGGGSVMVWAGISVNLRTQLYIVNLNSQQYIDEILGPLVVPFLQQIGPNAVFQDDNARPHRGRIVNDFVTTNNINRMDWPANSPYLNSIEHVWDELGRRVYRNNPPQTLQELRNRLMLEWQNMPQDVIRRCVDSMRKRCQACIAARGGHAAY